MAELGLASGSWTIRVTATRWAAAGLMLAGAFAWGCGDDAGMADASVDSGGIAACRPGETNFDGECADPRTSVKHCGTAEVAVECTAPADADPVCIDRECSIVCHSGSDADAGTEPGTDAGVVEKTPCGGVCVDLSSDLANCGACDTACHDPENGDPTCDGSCGIECEPGYEACGQDCYNLLVDFDHCGACDTSCGTNEVCANGTCVLSCPAGQARCGNSCVDIAKDADNCGGCDNACPGTAHGDPACSKGACGVACDAGFSACDGACVNKKTDENNCGACGNQCSTVNGTPTCTSGACAIVCDAHYDDCDSDVDTGCEVNLAEEETCGDCSTTCPSVGSPFCVDSTTPGTFACEANCGTQTACPVASPDHCADLTVDLDDCGACGTVCDEPISGDATGDAACASSNCGVDCIAPTDSEVTRGGSLACVDSDIDPQACGDTLEQCNKGERCTEGKCVKDQCARGLTNTDSGCVNLDSDAANCGAPDTTCSGIIGLTGDCIGQSCFCDLGECSGACAGSREVCDTRDCVDTASDPAHCGGCGAACNPGQFCKGGACRDFIYASADWECGADNSYPKVCASGPNTICVKDGAPCP